MRVYGIGTDLCDVTRIKSALDRHGERFTQRILCEAELATFRQRSLRWPERGPQFLATRFAAKEAFSKAVGLGMRMPMTWRHCEVIQLPSGAPGVALHGALAQWFAGKGLQAHLSLTDEGHMAAAFVVVCERPLQ